MSENTTIEWCDRTFNPWEGCQKVGPGCDHCYAETRNARFGGGTAINWGPSAPRRRTSPANWRKPLAWDKAHAEFFAVHGRRQRVFCASLADVFDNAVDPTWRQDLANLIQDTPNLDWLLLTKRIGNAGAMLGEMFLDGVPDNIWLGATIVNQEEANRDIPKLLAVPARTRFLSMEPLLGPVDLTQIDDGTAHREVPKEEWGAVDNDDSPPGLWWNALTGERHIMHGGANGDWSRTDAALDWIIVGGESGPKARPMHPEWVRDLRDQCAAAEVQYHFKQWGEWHPSAEHDPASHGQRMGAMAIHIDGSTVWSPSDAFALTYTPGWSGMCKVGKKAAGRLLDGVQHDGYPEVMP